MSSRNYQTNFVINGDASGGIRVIRGVRNEVGQLGTEFQSAGDKSQKFSRDLQSSGRELEFVQRRALAAGTAIAGMFAAGRLIQTADDYSQMASRVRLVTETTTEYAQVQERLLQISRNAYKPLLDISELYVNSVRPLQEVGFATRDVLDVTEALSAGMVISGTRHQQSASLVDQFSKAMIAGKLRGDAYNAMIRNAPRLQQALADGLNISTRELNEWAASGRLTAERVIPALNSQTAKMVDELERMPTSVEDARIVFNNAWTAYVGQANEAYSATGVLASGIELAADNIELLAEVGLAAAVVMAGRGVRSLGAYTAAVHLRTVQEREAAVATAQRMERDQAAAAMARRREMAERTQFVQEAQRARQRAQNALAEAQQAQASAQQDLQRIQSYQAMMAAERALETQRWRNQISEIGRQRSLARLMEIRRDEAGLAANERAAQQVLMQRQMAAQQALTASTVAEASATRMATLAKVELRRATLAATPATLGQAAAARAAAAGNAALALASRGAATAMTLVGGPAGAALLGTYALYRFVSSMSGASRESRELRDRIIDLRVETEDAVEAFEDLTLAQRNLTLRGISDEIEQQERAMSRSLQRIYNVMEGVGMPRSLQAYRNLSVAIQEVHDGLREAGTLTEVVTDNFRMVPDALLNGIANSAASFDTLAQSVSGLTDRKDALKAAADGVTGSLRDQIRALEANRSAAEQYLARAQDRLAGLMDPSREGEVRRWIAGQEGGVPEELAGQIIAIARYEDQYRESIDRRRAAEQAGTSAAREAERARRRIIEMYQNQALELQREIDLHGEVSEVAKLRYELEKGGLRELSTSQGEHLLKLREELSLLEDRSRLLEQYVPDLGRLVQLQRDAAAIDELGGGLGNLAARQLEREISELATRGLQVPTSIDASIAGPFGEAERLDREMDRYREQYEQRLEILRELSQEEHGVRAEALAAMAELERRHLQTTEQYERQSQRARLAGQASMYGDLAGLARVFAGEQSSIYRGLFVAHKAYSLASTMVSSFDAIAQAWRSAPFPANLPAVAMTTVKTGALQSALSAVQPVGMAHKGMDRIPREGTWLLDRGERVYTNESARRVDEVHDRVMTMVPETAGPGSDTSLPGAMMAMTSAAEDIQRFLARERRAAAGGGGGQAPITVDVEVINQGQPVDATATVDRIGEDHFRVRVLQTLREDLASGGSSSYAEQFASTYNVKRGAR